MIKENWIRGIGSVRCSGQIIVITLGMKITIPASTTALEKFVDDLANHSKAISFPSPRRPRERACRRRQLSFGATASLEDNASQKLTHRNLNSRRTEGQSQF
ncbi:MAG: hypothetical protein DME86_00715 [Verrucomicrobia bacterium]|nr:MAG: hypothetical protein DME86_00715 [Verrucomicrobiota bacterium]